MSSAATVVSVGAGVQDVFLHGNIFGVHREHGQRVAEFIYGSKNDVEGLFFSSGGGATNAAVTFARHGLHSSFLGRIANDPAGTAVLDDLHRYKVDAKHVLYTNRAGTGYSLILLAPDGERTILTYRGASSHIQLDDHALKGLHPDWFYVSSLSGDFESLKKLVNYARHHRIKIAINPGKGELKEHQAFREFLPDISILAVNKEEAALLFHGESAEELARHAVQHVPYVLITDGPHGAVASDGQHLYKAGMYEDVPVVDRSGAGDAFNSGFTASLAAGKTMEQAITFASANSTSVVSKMGAKAGILDGDTPLHHMAIVVKPLNG